MFQCSALLKLFIPLEIIENSVYFFFGVEKYKNCKKSDLNLAKKLKVRVRNTGKKTSDFACADFQQCIYRCLFVQGILTSVPHTWGLYGVTNYVTNYKGCVKAFLKKRADKRR
jgi:hypothetical protein